MGKPMSQGAREERRRRAAKLFAAGMSQADVARRCGVSRQSAMRWERAFKKGGAKALRSRTLGRPTKLSSDQVSELSRTLLQGPAAHGWSTDIWTLERISALVRKRFGVDYHIGHVWRLMRKMNWSLQRPTTRARERDEEAIARWKTEEWPRLKKTPGRKSLSSSSTKAASPKAR
jgi:transposase